MTLKQKLTIAILAIANGAVILTLATLLRPFDASDSPLPTPELEFPEAGALPQGECQWEAAQMLAQSGLGGTVMLTSDGSLCFEITYSLPPDETVDEAAQLVWTAFDVALALQEQGCEFTWVKATVLAIQPDARGEAEGDQSGALISASVGTDDLLAFGAGELSEEEFSGRVTYATFRLPR